MCNPQVSRLFVSQPTGSGKSLIYQSLPIIKSGVVIVVQPLIDQINKLKAKNMNVVRLAHDDNDAVKLLEIQAAQIIFASPEALLNNYREDMKDPILRQRLSIAEQL